MATILPLASQTGGAIELLLDAAFGSDRRGRAAYKIREGMTWIPQLSYALTDDAGGLVGTLQSWPVALHDSEGQAEPLIMVGPVAILPVAQRGGFGRALMDKVVADARAQATEPLMMIGDPEYYGRFWGFSAGATQAWHVSGAIDRRRLLALSVDGRPVPQTGMLGPRQQVESSINPS
ncbi:N-acetyltransferase [soil metagenome]